MSSEPSSTIQQQVLYCSAHGDWYQTVTSLQYKDGQNENLIGIKALQNMSIINSKYIILYTLKVKNDQLFYFCNNNIASVVSPTSGMASSIFMT